LLTHRAPLLIAVLALAGCMPYHRAAPGAENWKKGVSRVGVLSAVRVVEILPGNVEELHDAWTDQAAQNVVGALSAGLKAHGLQPKPLSWKGDQDLEEVRLLYAEVAEAIWRFTYTPYPFPHKRARFEYGVGSIGKILDRAGADVLLVAAGSDRVGSDGKKLSMFSGYRAMALLTLGLVDRQGNVVWFDVWGGASVDLRKPEDVKASVDKMLGELPGVAAPVRASTSTPASTPAPAAAPASTPTSTPTPVVGPKVSR
jgi:hypothetical protein